MQRRPTMRDVAELAGASIKSVSRVVNGEEGVTPGLASRIQSAVTELGYQVDARASQLRQSGSRSGAIGFALVDVANPFFSATHRGIEEVARDAGYLVLASSTDGDVGREATVIREFVRRRVEGLIVVATHETTRDVLASEVQRGTPMVLLDQELDGLDLDVVRSDHRDGARRATRHLLEHGHRRIAFLGDAPGLFSADERHAGWAEALTGAGIDPELQVVERWSRGVDAWAAIARRLLARDDRPTAIFAGQNYVTQGVVRVLHEMALAHEVAVVGLDDVEFGDLVDPGITVVPQDPPDLGRRAVSQLLNRLAGLDEPPRRDLLPMRVVPRGSGEIPPPA